MNNPVRVLICPRCQGRMMQAGVDGDMACFSCGHVTYKPGSTPPSPLKLPERRPAHKGWSLD